MLFLLLYLENKNKSKSMCIDNGGYDMEIYKLVNKFRFIFAFHGSSFSY